MLARTPLIQPHGGTDPRIGEPRPVEPFVDYGDLSHDTIVSIRNAADRIRNRHRDVIDGILKNGADLNVVKASLGHGRFGAWLKAEFGWSERTAENYMAAAREFGDKPAVASALSPTILYKLASRGTPAHIRDGVVSEVSAGVALPARTITDRIKRGKASGGCAKGHVPSGRLHAADPVSTSHQELAKASDVRHLEEAAHKRHAAASVRTSRRSGKWCLRSTPRHSLAPSGCRLARLPDGPIRQTQLTNRPRALCREAFAALRENPGLLHQVTRISSAICTKARANVCSLASQGHACVA
jgi:hypothetical protein